MPDCYECKHQYTCSEGMQEVLGPDCKEFVDRKGRTKIETETDKTVNGGISNE